MTTRADSWRFSLMGSSSQINLKRHLYTYTVQGAVPSKDIRALIDRDLPRTYPNVEWMTGAIPKIRTLLGEYAEIHRADGYLQGFNYIMTVLYNVFEHTEHADADTWWCFSKIIGYVRPLMPDFNVTWFHWYRSHWFEEFHQSMKKDMPTMHEIIQPRKETFSTLVTVKWFMVWFAQSVTFSDIKKIWDILVACPPDRLMHVYTLIAYEFLKLAAPTITYEWARDPTDTFHSLLRIEAVYVDELVDEIKRRF